MFEERRDGKNERRVPVLSLSSLFLDLGSLIFEITRPRRRGNRGGGRETENRGRGGFRLQSRSAKLI